MLTSFPFLLTHRHIQEHLVVRRAQGQGPAGLEPHAVDRPQQAPTVAHLPGRAPHRLVQLRAHAHVARWQPSRYVNA